MALKEKIRPDQIVTFSGRYVSPLDPRPEMIDIRDIAHALSNLCRFTGHTKSFYSVAQHSVLVSQICDYADAPSGLLHDAAEAYLSDLARPLKYYNSLGDVYRFAEKQLQEAIYRHFDLPLALPKSVKWADDVLLRSEARDLMPDTFPTPEEECHNDGSGDVLDFVIEPWTPEKSHGEFMLRFMELL